MTAIAPTALALIGDRNPESVAHACIPSALELASQIAGVPVAASWIETVTLHEFTPDLQKFAGVWIVPGSPYRNTAGVLAAIRWARENNRPLLGTCGGFQHMLIEFARNVCGVANADHGETNPTGPNLVVTPLACTLVDCADDIVLTPGSLLASLYGRESIREGYRCRYGPNREWQTRLERAGLLFSGFDAAGDVRAGELPSHPFFIGTLFQPERSARNQQAHPLVTAFIRAAAESASLKSPAA